MFATNTTRTVIGILGNDGRFCGRYAKSITGEWVDTFPMGLPLVNGKPVVSEWFPITQERAQAIVSGLESEVHAIADQDFHDAHANGDAS